jgi:hypothetical protein
VPDGPNPATRLRTHDTIRNDRENVGWLAAQCKGRTCKVRAGRPTLVRAELIVRRRFDEVRDRQGRIQGRGEYRGGKLP